MGLQPRIGTLHAGISDPGLTAIATGASLLYFNLDADWDVWAPYFLGSYYLSALAWQVSDPARRPRSVAILLLLMAVQALFALTVDFRSSIALALLVACALSRSAACNHHRPHPGNAALSAALGTSGSPHS